MLDGGSDNAGAQRLGEYQLVPHPASVVAQQIFLGHFAGDHQAVFGLFVVNGVAAENMNTGLVGLILATLEDFDQHVQWKFLDWEANDIEGKEWLAPHCINIGESVGSCDLPELIGIVHDGGEEVGALQEDTAAIGTCGGIEAHCCGVVSVVVADENVVVGGEPGQLTQNLGQVLRT